MLRCSYITKKYLKNVKKHNNLIKIIKQSITVQITKQHLLTSAFEQSSGIARAGGLKFPLKCSGVKLFYPKIYGFQHIKLKFLTNGEKHKTSLWRGGWGGWGCSTKFKRFPPLVTKL